MPQNWSRRSRLGIASILLVVFCAPPAVQARQGGRLVGAVEDAVGAALADVAITLRGPVTEIAQTDSAGLFAFEGLPAGKYELKAQRAGFVPASRTISLVPGEVVNLSLTLTIQVLAETVVTATKTGELDLQAIPMAVSALTGADLQRGHAHTVAHLAGLAPGVTFSQNSDYAQLSIRGIGSTVVFTGSDPSSAVYLDGVYIARPVMVLADFLDLERAEVLRGPQGTLYGRNAVGGAVNLVTKVPTNEVTASARLVAGNLDTLRSEARISGPLVRNRVMGSAAFLRGVREGYVRDLDHPDSPLGGEDVTALLGKVHIVFNRQSHVTLSGDVTYKDATPLTYAKVLAVKPGFELDNPADPHEVRTSSVSSNRTLQYGAALRFTTRLAATTTLTSLTGFRKLDFDNRNDADISELDLTAGHVQEMQHQWSEELTVSQERPGLTWIAGMFLFHEVDRQPITVQLGGPRLENRLDPNVEAQAGAIFGQATIGLTERVSAIAGLRYARERKTIDNAGQLSTLDSPVTLLAGSAYAYTDAISHSAWTPKLGVEVRPRENVLAYVSATRGFKSGGFNLTSQEAGRGYAPEWAWSYEGGLKIVLANGGARLNAAAFYADYTDLQVQTAIRPGVIDISNAAEATIRGIELEVTGRFVGGLHAGGHLAWLSATYDRYVAVGVGGVSGDVAGHRLSNAPEWSDRFWLEWNGALPAAGAVRLRADLRSQSTVFFTPFNDAIQRQRPYGILDVSAGFGPRTRHWSLSAYARNLTNEDYITGTFSSPPPAIGGRPGEPRQVGIQLTLQR
jgi:iron complex outermembrane receptor protein